MAHRTSTTAGRMPVHIEPSRADELPAGVPGLDTPPRPARDAAGRWVAGHPDTIAQARAAGRSRRAYTALAHTLGVTSDDPTWRAYLRQAEAFRRAQVRLLASDVGGGQCGPGPAALVASAALALAGSRMSYQSGDMLTGARLGAEARQHLLAAHELAAREAQARRAGQAARNGGRPPIPARFLRPSGTEGER